LTGKTDEGPAGYTSGKADAQPPGARPLPDNGGGPVPVPPRTDPPDAGQPPSKPGQSADGGTPPALRAQEPVSGSATPRPNLTGRTPENREGVSSQQVNSSGESHRPRVKVGFEIDPSVDDVHGLAFDGRPPLDARDAHLVGRYANALQVRDMVLPHQMGFRMTRTIERRYIDPNYWGTSGQVFREIATTEDGAEHLLTRVELHLSVHYPWLEYNRWNLEELNSFRDAFTGRLDAAFNRWANFRHILPDDSQLHIEADVNWISDPERPHIRLDGGFGLPHHRANSGQFEANIPLQTLFHEIIHHFGLPDQYLEAGELDRGTITAEHVDPGPNIMGEHRLFWPSGGGVADDKRHEISPTVGLQDAHLEYIHERYGFDKPPPALRPPTTDRNLHIRRFDVSQPPAYTADMLHLPADGRVKTLLGRPDLLAQFPAGVEFVQRARMLDLTQLTYPDVPLHELSGDHVRQVLRRVEAHNQIYGSTPEYNFSDPSFRMLGGLAQELGAQPGKLLPDVDLFRDAVRYALHDTFSATPVQTSEIDGMARLVNWSKAWGVWPDGGGSFADKLHRVAGEVLREPPTSEAGRRLAGFFGFTAQYQNWKTDDVNNLSPEKIRNYIRYGIE
jgi:hypothetical protein